MDQVVQLGDDQGEMASRSFSRILAAFACSVCAASKAA